MKGFTALMYHNLASRPTTEYDLDRDALREQLSWLRDEGYVMEGMAGLRARLSGNNIPDRYVVITFDDGHASNLEAAEIIAQAGARATFLLSVSHCRDHPDFLKPAGIQELAEVAEVGSHGISHRYLHKMGLDEMRAELVESRAWIEDVIGRRVDLLSLPGGGISHDVLREARQSGYDLVGTSAEWCNIGEKVQETRAVNRVMVFPHYSLDRLKAIVRGDLAFFAPRRARYEALRAVRRALPERLMLGLSRQKQRASRSLGGGS